MSRLMWRSLVAVVFAAASAVGAHAAPDEVLRPGERVRVILAEGDSRSVAIGGLEGGRWTLSVVPTGKSKAAPTFSLVDPDGEIVDLGKSLRNVGRGKGVKSFPMSKSGVWRLTFGTPTGKPGEVEISVTAKLPKTPRIAGTTAGEPATATIPFHALPSSSCDAKVKLAAKPAQRVDLRILAPGGDEVAASGGDANSAALDDVDIERTGGFALEVAGGPSKFSGTLRVKAPKPRRDLTFLAVEALPEFRSISPTATTNDVTRAFVLDGFGYTATNTLVLKLNGSTKRSAPVVPQPGGAGRATMSLDDLVPGTYTASVSLPGGRSVTLGAPIEVTNLAAAPGAADPPEAPGGMTFDLQLLGSGFDPAATVDVRRVGDGEAAAVSQLVRDNPHSMRMKLTTPVHKPGVYEVRVVEGGVPGPPLSGGFDVVGRKGPEYSLLSGGPYLIPYATAGDAELGRIGIAYLDGVTAVFQLVDVATGTIVSTFTAPRQIGEAHLHPRIAFHPSEKTWALNWTAKINSSTMQAWHGTAARSDLRSLQGAIAPWRSGSAHDNTQAVPDRVNGGWRFVWSQFVDDDSLGHIRSVPVSPQGTVDLGRELYVASHPKGYLVFPAAVARSDGDIVVVFLGQDIYGNDGILRAVIAPDNTVRVASDVAATSKDWTNVYEPSIALNPDDDSAMVCFTAKLDGLLRPGYFRLDPVTHKAGPLTLVYPDLVVTVAYAQNLVWSGERSEFVAVLSAVDVATVSKRSLIRRVDPDGSSRQSAVVEHYDGVYGWLGTVGDEVHLIRCADGVDDGVFDDSLNRHVVRLTPLR